MLRKIVGKQYFYSKVKKIISSSLKPHKGKVVLLIGQPGSGKSVFMCQLYEAFQKKQVNHLTAIRAEFLREKYDPKEVYEAFLKLRDEDEPKILILDSLDVLAYSRRKELQEWLYYIDKLKNFKFMTIVCASRSFEAEHLYPMNQQEWSEKITIDLLPENFLQKIFNKLNYDYQKLSSELQKFLRIPLHLRITTEIIEKGHDPKDICTLQGLYAKLCELLDISSEEMGLLAMIASEMIKNKTIFLSYPAINVQLLDSIKKMERSGLAAVISVDDANKQLSFSHQTLVDYFVAWNVINENVSIYDFVVKHNQSLFIRPTIRHIIGLLRAYSESRLFNEIDDLFFNKKVELGFKQNEVKIRTYIKTGIIANIASWINPSDKEAKFLVKLITQPKDKNTFLNHFFQSRPNVGWYEVLKDSYILPVLKKRDYKGVECKQILYYLTTIVKQKPTEILDICSSLLNEEKNREVEWVFYKISNELASVHDLEIVPRDKYVVFLEERIRKGFVDRYFEIKESCRRITKYFPEKGLKLYLENALKEIQNKDIKIFSSQGSLTQSFAEILPEIYKKMPFKTLIFITEFIEKIMSESYAEGRGIPDWPNELLYSVQEERYGLDALYNWYKNAVLDFCNKVNKKTKEIIHKLEKSKWESQKQLSMLCKMRNTSHYKKDVIGFINKILDSDLQDKSMYKYCELYKRALESVFEFLSNSKRRKIFDVIYNLKFDDKLQVVVWIWEPLHFIPKRFYTKRVENKIEEIRKKYKFKKRYRRRVPIISTGFKVAQPSISAKALKAKKPKDLFDFLVRNKNLKERWDFENNKFYGGVDKLAQIAAEIFLEDLVKYKSAIENLAKDSANDEYLRWVLLGLSNKKEIAKKHVVWTINLVKKVYKREKLQLALVRYLRVLIEFITRKEFGKLKNVIVDLSEAKQPEKDKFFEYREQGYSNDALTEGINSTRGVIAETILLLASKFKDKYLLDILDRLSNDKTTSVRAVLVRYLPYAIKGIGWDKCFSLFSNIYNKNPEEYAEIIPHFLRYAPKEKINQIRPILKKMHFNRGTKVGTAYAVTMTIYYIRGMCTEKELLSILADKELLQDGKIESFNLLAKQLGYEDTVDISLNIINKLLDQEENLKGKTSILFRCARPEDLQKLVQTIEKIIEKPALRGEVLYYIFEYLEKCLLFDALKVFELLEQIILEAGDDFYDTMEYIPASHSKAPLNIINTIFECYPDEEKRAQKALDRLVELKWSGVEDYFKALDRI